MTVTCHSKLLAAFNIPSDGFSWADSQLAKDSVLELLQSPVQYPSLCCVSDSKQYKF